MVALDARVMMMTLLGELVVRRDLTKTVLDRRRLGVSRVMSIVAKLLWMMQLIRYVSLHSFSGLRPWS